MRVKLEAAADDAPSLRHLLTELLNRRATLESLKASQLARHVRKRLSRHADGQVACLSRRLVGEWSALLEIGSIHDASVAVVSASGARYLLHDDDSVASVLAHCDAATLLVLKSLSTGWHAKIRALGGSAAWLCDATSGASLDVTLALASGATWHVETALRLRAAPQATLLTAFDPHTGAKLAVDLAEAIGPTAWPPPQSGRAQSGPAVARCGRAQERAVFPRSGCQPARLEVAALVCALAHPRSALTALSVARNIGDEGTAAVVRACAARGSLTSISLQSTGVGIPVEAGGPEAAAGAPPTATAIPAICDLLKHSRSLHELSLSGNTLGSAGASRLASALLRNGACSLSELDLRSTSIACAGVKELARWVGRSDCIRRLDLSCNGFGLEGAKALASALACNGSLRWLDISRSQVGPDGMLAIGNELLRSTVSRLGCVVCDAFRLGEGDTTLSLCQLSLGLGCVTLLSALLLRNSKLRSLALSRSYLGGDAAVPVLARAVARSPSLERLDVDGGVLPVAALRGGTASHTVDLAGRRLGPASAEVIAALLRGNGTLKSLVLRSNALGNRGAYSLAEALKANPTLTELDLRGNSGIRPHTIALLASRVPTLLVDTDAFEQG